MIGLDTNVLVRYLTQDHASQAKQASRLIDEQLTVARPGFISLVVLTELMWVLESLFKATREELLQTIEDILQTPTFHIEQRQVAQAALLQWKKSKSKTGWADMLIAQLAKQQGCTHMVTFDKAAVRYAGMQLLSA